MKKRRGCSSSMWLCSAVTSMPLLTQRLHDRVHLLGGQHEIAGDRRLAAAGRLKIDRVRRAHAAGIIHAAFPDRLGARNAELIDAAVVRALGAERLVDRGGIEIDRRRRCRRLARCRSSGVLLSASAVVQRRRQLHRIALSQHMHVHRERLGCAADGCAAP